jgi:hypothetical protein
MLVEIEQSPDPTCWHIRCKSNCLAPQIAFDYGKNYENVETWVREINKLVQQKANSSAG